MLLALALRLPMLSKSFIGDEICTLEYARQPLPGLFSYVAAHDSHPPLYYLIIHFCRMLGTNEMWIRLPGVLLGVGTCYLIFLIASEFTSRRGALIAAVFAAISPRFVAISQLARNYVLVTFLIALSTYLLIRIIRRPRLILWVGYVLASAAALYSFYYAAYAIVAQGLAYAVAGRHSRRQWLAWLAAQAGIVALFLPWVPWFLMQLSTVKSDPTGIDTAAFGGALARSVVWTIASVEPLAELPTRLTAEPYVLAFAGLLGAGLIAGCVYAYRRRAARGWAIMATLLLAVLGQAVGMRIALNGYIAPNYLAFASIFGCVLAGMAFGRARSILVVGLTIAICLVGLVRLPETYRPIDDWRGAGELLAKRVRPGEYVATLYNGAAECVDHYSMGKIKAHGLPDGVRGADPAPGRDLVCAVLPEHIGPIGREFALHKTVWMVWYHTRRGSIDRGGSLVRDCLSREGFSVVESHNFPSIEVERYVRAD